MSSSLLVRKQPFLASDNIATHFTAPFSTLLFSSGGEQLAVHVSVEGDFLVSQTDTLYELHDAVATSVGWKFHRGQRQPCKESDNCDA